MTKAKKLEKGAIVKMRDSYKELRENAISKELKEALRKKDQSKQNIPRKIAQSPQDAELP